MHKALQANLYEKQDTPLILRCVFEARFEQIHGVWTGALPPNQLNI